MKIAVYTQTRGENDVMESGDCCIPVSKSPVNAFPHHVSM